MKKQETSMKRKEQFAEQKEKALLALALLPPMSFIAFSD